MWWPMAGTLLCVSTAAFPHKMNKDRVTFSFLMCFVKCTFSTELTCNHSANKLSVVANIVLCAQCTSPRPLSLWPCTWTLTVCFFLQANQTDVCDSLSPQQWATVGEPGLGPRLLHKTPSEIAVCLPQQLRFCLFSCFYPFHFIMFCFPRLTYCESMSVRSQHWLGETCSICWTGKLSHAIEWCVLPSCGQHE